MGGSLFNRCNLSFYKLNLNAYNKVIAYEYNDSELRISSCKNDGDPVAGYHMTH